MKGALRKSIAGGLCGVLAVVYAQPPASIAPAKSSMNAVIRPYFAPSVPEIRTQGNSARLKSLMRGGALYLTAQDAIALAIENNIDLEVARYNPLIADWNLERSRAGGALPGVPSGASQAGSVASGQGVQGSQAAAGVAGGGSAAPAASTSTSISQIGPVVQTLDPIIQQASTFSHTSTPQANTTQSLVDVLVSDSRAYTTSYQQGYLLGGQITLTGTENYLKQNAPTDVLNPSYAPTLSLSFQQALMRGFGVAVNARNITVSQLSQKTTDLNFRMSVISTVATVLSTYYQLAAAFEDVKAKRSASEVAGTLFKTVQRQVDLGSVAPTELITSENLVVTAKQDLVNSQATLDQLEITLKNLLSRNGTSDPLLGPARIVPVDQLAMPAEDGVGEISEMVKEARAKRPEFALDRINIESSKISMIGTRNGLQPNIQAFGGESEAGLGGPAQVTGPNGANAYFIGGLGTGVGQIFRRNFPTDRIGVFGQAPLANRQAMADQAIDELTLRQTELSAVKRSAQVEVDVQNGVIALRQARASYDAAVKNRQLQEQLVAAEQKKYDLGASIPTNVVQIERDLAAAQSSELGALTSYIRARVGLDRTLGRTLEANHVTIEDALTGEVKTAAAK
jgi:outer membrane protein TolC